MEASHSPIGRSLERLALAACLAVLVFHNVGRPPDGTIRHAKPTAALPDCLLAVLQGSWQLAAGDVR
jgi:hypothetical protein